MPNFSMRTCSSCGKTWWPRKAGLPKKCPSCQAPYTAPDIEKQRIEELVDTAIATDDEIVEHWKQFARGMISFMTKPLPEDETLRMTTETYRNLIQDLADSENKTRESEHERRSISHRRSG